jgi:hypothetical protein
VIPRLVAAVTLAVSGVFVLGAPAGAVDTTAPGAPQGNATPTLATDPGVSVVAMSAPTDGKVAVLVHNGSTRPVRIVRVDVVATTADGGRATRVRTKATYPQVLAPDSLALAGVSFGRKHAPAPDAQLTAKVRSARVASARARRTLSVGELALSPIQTGPVAQTMAATITNGTAPSWKAKHPAAAVICFGEAGNPSTFASARAKATRVAPGASVPVSVPLTSLCPAYLVAARAS